MLNMTIWRAMGSRLRGNDGLTERHYGWQSRLPHHGRLLRHRGGAGEERPGI